jgi:transcriptional regulator with XRE-family HTH domain
MSDVVALLLGDDMPAGRLGELLKAGRKRRGWKRARAAEAAGITADELRAYERGTATIPAEVCARLADAYGEDLTAHVPLRFAPEFEAGADSDDVIATYIEMVRQLRRAKPGDALALRAFDLAALATALESDPDTLEQRIVDALGCTRAEARALHRQLLQRKVVLPVAGLAASVLALAGIQAAHASTETPTPPAPTAVTTTVPGPVVAPPTTQITRVPATTTTIETRPTTTVAPAVHDAPAAHESTPPPAPAPEVTTPMTRPVISPDDTVPEGVLPGEVPYDPFKK